ncbi:hypothetical protein MAR_032857, partial [Mya arenaria]
VLLVHKQRVKPPECAPSFPQLKLCNQTLTFKEKTTFLGLTFDKYLKWDFHINSLIARCEKDLNLLRTIKGKEWGTDKKIVTGAYRSTRTIALQAECGELPLNYQREIN